MIEDITKEITKMISETYYDVLLTALDEQEHRFFIIKSVIEFMAKLRDKNINLTLDDIFTDKIICKMYDEADKYIGS